MADISIRTGIEQSREHQKRGVCTIDLLVDDCQQSGSYSAGQGTKKEKHHQPNHLSGWRKRQIQRGQE